MSEPVVLEQVFESNACSSNRFPVAIEGSRARLPEEMTCVPECANDRCQRSAAVHLILRCLRRHSLELDVCGTHYLSVVVALSGLEIRCSQCRPSLRPLRLHAERRLT